MSFEVFAVAAAILLQLTDSQRLRQCVLGTKDLVTPRHSIISQKNRILIIKLWYFITNIQEWIRISDLKFITVSLHVCFKKLPLWPITGRHLLQTCRTELCTWHEPLLRLDFITHHTLINISGLTHLNTERYLSSQWIILWKQCAFLTSKWKITLLISMHSKFSILELMPNLQNICWGPVRHDIHLEVWNYDSASIKHASVFMAGPNSNIYLAKQPTEFLHSTVLLKKLTVLSQTGIPMPYMVHERMLAKDHWTLTWAR